MNNLPYNSDCERVVLGSMILDQTTLEIVIGQLSIDDFYEENTNHRAVFSAIQQLHHNHDVIDVHTINDYLVKLHCSDSIGGVEYLLDLTSDVISLKNIDHYIGLLKDYSSMRRLILTLENVKKDALTATPEEFSSFSARVESQISAITNERKLEGFKKGRKIAVDLQNKIETIHKGGANTFYGVTTGFSELDNKLNGLQKGALVVLAARPSQGKTALGINIAYNCAKKTRRPVAIFSIEMSNEEIMKRLFAKESRVPMDLINRVEFDDQQMLLIKHASEKISDTSIYIDDTGGISIDELCSKAKKLKNELGDLALILVDYIGKVNVNSKLAKDEVSKINIITGALKQLAKEVDAPVLALAQVNRKVEDRDGGKAELSNLKGSSSIEQDADQVLFIHNPKSAVSNSKDKKDKFNDDDDEQTNGVSEIVSEEENYNLADLIQVQIKKNRNGTLGDVNLLFFKAYQSFDTPSPQTNITLNGVMNSMF